MPGGSVRKKKDAGIGNGSGGGEEKLVNSKNPTIPLIYLLNEGTWAETWQRSRSGSPLTGREILNYRATHEMVRAKIASDI
jgi:hypothetical protein